MSQESSLMAMVSELLQVFNMQLYLVLRHMVYPWVKQQHRSTLSHLDTGRTVWER